MASMASQTKAYSAPGKALVAGGYLVLDPEYTSYATALSARMHAVISAETPSDSSLIVVSSPQFGSAWTYEIGPDNTSIAHSSSRNPFLEATVSTVLKYIRPSSRFNLAVTIYSDPGFHSQANTTVRKSANGQKHFLFHDLPIEKVPKTGLGSSAGLVSVVTAALLHHFHPDVTQNTIHNTAQVAHCIAQKKIGSGFDVAAAVYGSIVYRRFDPAVISDVVAGGEADLAKVINSTWDFGHEPCTLPPHIKILMGDIKGGSETPKLVSKVLQWKKEKPHQSREIYGALDQANQDLMASLQHLHQHYANDKQQYLRSIECLKTSSVAKLESESQIQLGQFGELIDAIKRIRSNLRSMTRASGAEIEPESQTKLLDDCSTLEGCLGGVVPGAGGYDAICLLVVDTSIESIVASTQEDKRFSTVSWLDLHEQSSGLVHENPADYVGL